MKKFIFSMIAIMMAFVGTLSAQGEVLGSTFGDNWFAGVSVGASAPQDHAFDFANHDSWIQLYRFNFGAEVGKNLTPITTLAVSDEAYVNTTGVHTAIDENKLWGDVRFNLTNLFLGYKNAPRTFELEVGPSIGWVHYFGLDGYNVDHVNFVGYRATVAANLNLGKYKQWQISVRPNLTYVDRFRHYNGRFGVNAAVVYRFKGDHSNSHNFVRCDKRYTEEQYNDLYNKNNELCKENMDLAAQVRDLKNREPEKVVQTVTKEAASNVYRVTFAFNSSDLNSDAKNVLSSVPANSTVKIDSYASKHGGDSYTNKEVSDNRAQAVKSYLESRNVKVSNVVSHGAESDSSQQEVYVTVL